ncbi:MAG: DUF3299 domain-containing protein [Methylococcaceae bacterium]|nr:DUF3299 domain-containing protein [Methylococcaceae bacterium]
MRICTRLATVITFSAFSIFSAFAAEWQEYRTGDTLKKEKSALISSDEPYKKLNWDELTPADWDPLKPLKGLNLDKLEDSDPRARDALIAVGEAWKNAPIIPALNGQRVKIAGFVVPLDINKKKVKEFLLVPYFGACIHVPPPPSNQVVHAFNAKIDNKQENEVLKSAALIQGPITIIGILETVSSNTSMGSAGYKIQVETIEPYKEPERN